MKISSLLPLLAATAHALVPVPRNPQPILTSISEISSQITKLHNIVNTFNGGFAGTITALQIQGEATTLLNDVKSAVSTVQKTSALNEPDSTQVVSTVVRLQTGIYDVLDALATKKPAFDTAILGVGSASFLVKIDLQDLRKATASLGSELTKKLVAELQRLAPLITSDIDFHFARALQVYS